MPWSPVRKRIYTEGSAVTDTSAWDRVWDSNRPRFELDFSLLNFHKQLVFEMFPKIDFGRSQLHFLSHLPFYSFSFFFNPIFTTKVFKHLVLTSSSEISLKQILSWQLCLNWLFTLECNWHLISIWGFERNCRCTTIAHKYTQTHTGK